MHSIRMALLGALVTLAACGKSDWPGEEERTLEEGHAPTPYTEEQLRDGCPSGRVCVFEIESAGGFVIKKRYRYLDADEQGVTLEVAVEGPGQKPASKSRATWRELRKHASFPKESTRIEEQMVETKAGTFECLRYIVTSEEKGKTVVKYLDFARELPGMPVRMTLEYDGEKISSMTLVSHSVE